MGDGIYKDDIDNVLFKILSSDSIKAKITNYNNDIFDTYNIKIKDKNILLCITPNGYKSFPIFKYRTRSKNESISLFELYNLDNKNISNENILIVYAYLFDYKYIKKSILSYIQFISNFDEKEMTIFDNCILKIIKDEHIYAKIIQKTLLEDIEYIRNIVNNIYDFYDKNIRYLLHQKGNSILMDKCCDILRCIKNNIIILTSLKYNKDINDIMKKIIYILANE